MRISKQPGKVVKLLIDGYQIEQVSSFCYLGSMITEDQRKKSNVELEWQNQNSMTGQLSTTTKKQMTCMERHIVCCRSLDNEESRHTEIGGI